MAKINGTGRSDVLRGTAGDDVINGRNGNDVLYGGGGDDVIYTGSGTDEVHAGAGNDLIVAGFDPDLLYGDAGADTFSFDAAVIGALDLDAIYDLNFAEGDKIILGDTIIASNADLLAMGSVDGWIVTTYPTYTFLIHDAGFNLVLDGYVI
jgi:Ca2+-binding RTX toxin-like protein